MQKNNAIAFILLRTVRNTDINGKIQKGKIQNCVKIFTLINNTRFALFVFHAESY